MSQRTISEIDENFGTNQPCLKNNEEKMYTASDEEEMFTNYIGILQDEICEARGWSLPKYEYFQGIEGENNNKERLYTVKCSAGPYESKDVGRLVWLLMWFKPLSFHEKTAVH